MSLEYDLSGGQMQFAQASRLVLTEAMTMTEKKKRTANYVYTAN